jgi:hypothetical protein
MQSNLLDKCAQILNCRISQLRDRLFHPNDREVIIKALNGKRMQTTYKDLNGFTKTFTFGGLSNRGADHTMAYGRLGRPFNVCVAAHFYVRHRIKLHNPYMPCAVECFPDGQEDRYYPLELCQLVEEAMPTWLGRLFTEIKDDEVVRCDESDDEEHTLRIAESDDDDDDGGRAECSQKSPTYHYW